MQIHRNTNGDYTPDPIAASYPPDLPPHLPALTADALMDGYLAEREPRPSTDKRWRSIMRRLAEFLGKPDMNRITEDDIVKWKDHRLAAGIAPRTIRDADLAAPRNLFNWAIGARTAVM